MSTDGGGELTKRRPLPEWMYAYPDPRSERIAELEVALLDSNDEAAKLRDTRDAYELALVAMLHDGFDVPLAQVAQLALLLGRYAGPHPVWQPVWLGTQKAGSSGELPGG